ncbi:MAG TPA: FAD-dependent oxidoreductase [Ignavibacteria bacterium]
MAIVRKYKAKVEQIKNPLPDIFTATFSSDRKFQYLPGQFLHLALDEYDGISQWPESRCFSMQSNPNEPRISITFSDKGKFTKRMANELDKGKEVWLKLPYGELFTQPHNKANTVFIAGGTGITPYLSLFTHESFNEYTNPHIYLGFRSEEYNIYKDELRGIRNNSCNSSETKFVKFVFEDTDGIIDIQSIFNENSTNSDYFISGPPLMIKSFRNFLLSKGLEGNKIRTDEWE